MIHGLKPYPAYKDSDVPWLGQVPQHWEVRRLKNVCHLAYGDSLPTETRQVGQVAVFGSNGRVGFHTYANTRSPCIVIGRKGSFGKVNFSDNPVFAIDTTFFVDERFTKANLRWLSYLLGWLRLDEVSKDSAVPGLSREDAYQRTMAYPTAVAEQDSIVRYLRHVDRQIRHYVCSKQRLIALLNEQKQAIIYQAVTRGLDPYVQLKPSGEAWLEDVPEHWVLARLKDVAVVQTGLTLGKNYQGMATESYPYLRVANVQHGRLDLTQIKHVNVPPRDAAGTTLKAGDVLMTEGGDIDKLGRGCVWHGEIPECLHQNHIFAVRCDREVLLPEFLVGVISSRLGRTYFQITAKQTTNLASTNSSTLRAFPIMFPPVSEQRAILEEVASQTTQLDAAISRTENEIALSREFRVRLIADVVTGKLDVREAAAALPEEVKAPENIEDGAALSEEDEEIEQVETGTEAEEELDADS